jgi:hypothetical protein
MVTANQCVAGKGSSAPLWIMAPLPPNLKATPADLSPVVSCLTARREAIFACVGLQSTPTSTLLVEIRERTGTSCEFSRHHTLMRISTGGP